MFGIRPTSLIGAVLLAFAIWLIVDKQELSVTRRRTSRNQPHADELAERLQNAWADHHTRA